MRLAIMISLLLVNYSLAEMPSSKPAIPDESAQNTALAVISNAYKRDYEEAKTVPQKIALAKKLLNEGLATTDDRTSRYVMFRVSRDLSAQQGDLAAAFDAISRIEMEFEVDQFQMQLDVATTVLKVSKVPKDRELLCEQLLSAIDLAVAGDRYDIAKPLALLTLNCIRETRSTNRIRQLTAKSKEVEEVSAGFEKAKESIDVLRSNATDESANAVVGKFLCFLKGDWKRGISMLAIGGDEKYAPLAILELADKPDALQIGDAWWKVSEELKDTAKLRTQTHSAEWYRQALPQLSGLTKARVESVLSQLQKSESKDEEVAGPISLLDKDSLKGWEAVSGTDDAWIVKSGVLIIGGPGPFLRTSEVYQDFDLHLEYLLPAECNSGVFLRGRYEVQLIDAAVKLANKPVPPVNQCGAIVGEFAPARVVHQGPNKWNTLDVRLVGNVVTVKMNGVMLIEKAKIKAPNPLALDTKESEAGPIALQNYSKNGNGSSVGAKFRNIKIQPIQ